MMKELAMQPDTKIAIWHRNIAPILPDIAQFALRVAIGGVFWTSGRTKVDTGLTVSESAVELFREEYRLPFVAPELAAHLAAYAEHIFPILLLVGLATRLSASALFGMTFVIQTLVYPDAFLSVHLGWFAMASAIIVYGPGRFSLDHAIKSRRTGLPLLS
jgi:putative oxidoreductase